MNLLLLKASERVSGDLFRIVGQRADELIELFRLKEGDLVCAGELGGLIGEARILKVASSLIELEAIFERVAPARLPVGLIVAVPRPQVIRRVLFSAAIWGVQDLYFLRSEGCEQSYLDSKALGEQEILRLLEKGVQQSVDTVLPNVEVQRRFLPFVQDRLPELISEQDLCLVCDPEGGEDLKRILQPLIESGDTAFRKIWLAIGPERGWSAFELSQLGSVGFCSCTLGSRVLTVDLALAGVLGSIATLLG